MVEVILQIKTGVCCATASSDRSHTVCCNRDRLVCTLHTTAKVLEPSVPFFYNLDEEIAGYRSTHGRLLNLAHIS